MKNIWGKELKFPENLLYTPEFLWVGTEPEDNLRIGISHIGVKSVKELLYIRVTTRAGNHIKKGDAIGIVETNKRVWEIIAPVSGEVLAINSKLSAGDTNPISNDAYGDGWILELKKLNETDNELKLLLRGDTAEGKQWIKEQVEAVVPLME